MDDGNSKDKNKLTSLCSLSGQLSHRHSQPQELVSDADLDAALSAAVTCAVLAPPGPARTRVLAGLGRDERSARLPLSGVLASVRSQRLLTREDAAALDSALTMPHHRAVGGDGATVLERALREHNLSAAAGVYGALTLEALGELLGLGRGAGAGGRGGRQKSAAEEAVSRWRTRCRGGISRSGLTIGSGGGTHLCRLFQRKKTQPSKQEAMAAKMVAEGRLRATIDQVDGIITFEEEEAQGGGSAGGGLGAGGAEGENEDEGGDDAAVAALCEGLDVVAAAVAVG